MSEKFPRIDYGENGPDDGGYGEAVDSGTPDGFDAILDSITHTSMGEIPSSHANEDIRDDDQKDYPERDEPILDETLPEGATTITNTKDTPTKSIVVSPDPIGSQANKQDIINNGKDDEIIDAQLETLSEAKEKIPAGYLAYAEEIIRATSYEDLSEEFDVYEQKAYEIKTKYDEEIGKMLEEKLESLFDKVYDY